MTIKYRIKIISVALVMLPAAAINAQEKPFVWPNKAKAAVNLAYDDALPSQLDHAIPALNRHKLKGTFYVPVAAQTINTRLDEWRNAARKGHELANHSIFHQCSGSLPEREWVTVERDLDRLTVAQMRDQIVVANHYLHAIDGKTERTFTPPCIDLNAGGQNYVVAISNLFVAIKAKSGGVTPDMHTLDPYAVGVAFPANVSGQQLIAIAKEAAAKGTMANFTFHGIGGDHLSVTKEAHEELLKYLAENRGIYWTDTFIDIMKYVKMQQNKSPQRQH